jgi:hypothetical protein
VVPTGKNSSGSSSRQAASWRQFIRSLPSASCRLTPDVLVIPITSRGRPVANRFRVLRVADSSANPTGE